MIKEVRLPEISENVETGDVIKVLVAVGDIITADQSIVELETEKAVLEVPSPYAGKVTEVLVKVGDTINIDQAILKVDTEATTEDAAEPKTETAPKAPAGPPKAKQPKASPTVEPDARPAPVPVDVTPATPSAVASPAPSGQAAPASPALRRLARELGVDINKVPGSGPGGRILKDDLKSYARTVVSGANAAIPGAGAGAVTENTKWGPVLREPMSKVRQVTARTMHEAWTTIPHVTQYDKVDITEMDELRKQYSKKLEQTGNKLTMTAIILKVAASALKVFPQFNASIDMETKEVIYKRYYHIGVAVETDRGLLVPVIRQVDKKNISELAAELSTIAEKARDKKLTPAEMEGGTFTISNLGGIGGTNFSPIVYPPQVAILGVARSTVEPVFTNNQFEPRLLLPMSVSYDHRIIDGADGVRFLRWIVRALEEPLLLALEG